jgi:HAE1 family hydrophobic/amphiphilic exporter-1
MLLVLRDYKWVDISTTLVIACFFASMMFMTGIIGRFMFSFPFVITITLLASLVCSLTIVPALTIAFQRGKHPSEEETLQKKQGWFSRLLDSKPILSLNPIIAIYEKALVWVLETKKRRRLILTSIFLAFFLSASLPITGLLKSEFFPATDEDIFSIDIEGQPGQKIEVTSDISKQVEATLK